jgi:alpha-D-ribose 1-methylphosphonate 5-triphosphate synthase subunit PhnG
LHGDESGSVDRKHNLPGSRFVEADPKRLAAERNLMGQSSYVMGRSEREAVLAALIERCSIQHWSLLAAHVRTNHVHVVVDAAASPERVMNDLKSYASRIAEASEN